MKYNLLSFALLIISSVTFSQTKSSLWNSTTKKSDMIPFESEMILPEKNLFTLNIEQVKTILASAPKRTADLKNSNTILAIPNQNGQLQNFKVFENSVLDPALAARYPEIKSYIGVGIDNPTAVSYFSVSPLGFKSMTINADRTTVFIEPISRDLTTYTVYDRADKQKVLTSFECSVVDKAKTSPEILLRNADDSTLRTFRLAVSCTGEYAAYFGGTKAQALAAINASMTRVNGVFENDFAVRMVLIANNDLVLYTNASTDPYTTSYNSQLQSTLTSVIGESNYDVGHLFVRASNNGNAGCIGCVCVNGSKGSAFTSSTIPTGDNNYHIFVVIKPSDSTSGPQFILGAIDNIISPGTNNVNTFLTINNTYDQSWNNSNDLISSEYVPNNKQIISFEYISGINRTTYMNGNNIANDLPEVRNSTSSNNFIGGIFQNNTFTNLIHEIIIYTNPLSIVERQQIENYLSNKWLINLNELVPVPVS